LAGLGDLGGSLAHTGTSGLPQMIALVGLLVGTGLTMAVMGRRRRTRQH